MSRAVKVTGGLLLTIIVVALLGPLVSPHDYDQTNFDALLQAPTLERLQLFGTDDLGRDLFVRSMLGVQVTMLVAVVASIVSLFIGVAYGAVAGYAGGRVDALMMRFVDTLYALPFNDLLFRAQSVHRANFDPNEVQVSTLLSIKTGGCPEDCAYCPQSVHHESAVEAESLMDIEAVVDAAKTARQAGARRALSVEMCPCASAAPDSKMTWSIASRTVRYIQMRRLG